MTVIIWMIEPNILPLEGVPQLTLPSCIAIMSPWQPLGVLRPILSLLTTTLSPHWEDEGTKGRKEKKKKRSGISRFPTHVEMPIVRYGNHRWELPVLRYHKILVIYPYTFFVVINQLFSNIIFINDYICILTGSPG